MTKEEILEKKADRDRMNIFMDDIYFNKRVALKAMSEYAKQEAIAFAGWNSNLKWADVYEYDSDGNMLRKRTTEELYELFLKSKTE